jgi:FkbM family methyltransferase
MLVRDRGDIGIILEQRTWDKILPYVHDKSVLDLGGHIGAAANYFLLAGAKRVISVEPDPANCKIFSANHAKKRNVKLIQAAVMPNDAVTKLYLGTTYSATNTVHPTRGRHAISVQSVSFESLLTTYKPDVLKVDIEGGEYNLDWNLLGKSVRAVAFEFHQHKRGWSDRQREVDETMLSIGFSHLGAAPKPLLTYRKSQITTYHRS